MRRPLAILFFIVLCSSNIYAVPFGRLDINYSVVASMDSDTCKVLQYITGEEGFDGLDNTYGPLFSPYGVKSKIVSIIPGYELAGDVRPRESTSPIYLELSIHRQNGNPTTISAANYFSFDLFEYDSGSQWVNEEFGDMPITIQQYNPSNPNEVYPMYDVRNTIDLNGGIINLSDLNGTYNSEEVFAWFTLRFDRWLADVNDDGNVNLHDFAVIADDWQETRTQSEMQNGNALKGDISGEFGIPDGVVNLYDLMVLCEQWLNVSP